MGGRRINGWEDLDYDTVVLTQGVDNTPEASEYLVLVPLQDNERVVSFTSDEIAEAGGNWMMEVANGDPTQTRNILLIGGSPAQTPPQIVLPSGFSQVRIGTGHAQRVVYIDGVGWCPLFSGVLS